jgi:hypothetical protein
MHHASDDVKGRIELLGDPLCLSWASGTACAREGIAWVQLLGRKSSSDFWGQILVT